jgi:hypothetical protein
MRLFQARHISGVNEPVCGFEAVYGSEMLTYQSRRMKLKPNESA